MIDFIMSVFATVLNWLVLNVWLVVYWVLVPLIVAFAVGVVLRKRDVRDSMCVVAGVVVFVVLALVMMVYAGEFGFIF